MERKCREGLIPIVEYPKTGTLLLKQSERLKWEIEVAAPWVVILNKESGLNFCQAFAFWIETAKGKF